MQVGVFHATALKAVCGKKFRKSQERQLVRLSDKPGRHATGEKTSLETSTPIITPTVREIQAGTLLKIFWFVLDFMIIAFANLKGAGRRGGRVSFRTKACDFR